jgi:hypothetical protein
MSSSSRPPIALSTPEIGLDQPRPQADRGEQPRGLVPAHRGDADLAHHLEQPRFVGLHQARRPLSRLAVEAGIGAVAGQLEGQVRADRRGAVSDQRRQVVDGSGVGGVDDDRSLQPVAAPLQRFDHRPEREQAGDRRPLAPGGAIAQDHDRTPAADRVQRAATEGVEGLAQPRRPADPGEGHRQHHRFVGPRARLLGPPRRRPEPRQLIEVQDRRPNVDRRPGRDQRLGGKDVGPSSQIGAQLGDDPLPQVIQRWVGDLREALIEVVEQGARLGGEHRDPRGVPHRSDRLLAGLDHRDQDLVDLLLAHPKQAEVEGLPGRRLGADRDQAGVEARAGVLFGPGRIFEPHLPGLEHQVGPRPAPEQTFGDDGPLVDREHAGLRGQVKSVPGHRPAAGAKAVPIEARADHLSVGVRQKRRAVPGLHRSAPELVKRRRLGLRRRHHDRQDLRELGDAAAVPQRLHHLVEAPRVGDLAVGEQLVVG